MRYVLSALILECLFLNISAQYNFERVYSSPNYDGGFSVIQTPDSNFVFTGFWGVQAFVFKSDANGDLLWDKYYLSQQSSVGYSIVQTTDGGFAIGGTSTYSNYNFYLVKTDYNGDSIWTKRYGSSLVKCLGYDVKQVLDGGFVLVGHADTLPGQVGHMLLTRTDVNGEYMWSKVYGGRQANIEEGTFRSVQVASNGDYVMMGIRLQTSYEMYLHDIVVVRTNSNGDTLWVKQFGGSNDDIGMSISSTSDNGFIITGATMSSGNGAYDVYLLKIDSNGSVVWNKTTGGLDDDWGNYVSTTSDNGYIISGSTKNNSNGGTDVYLIKIDAFGNVIWSKTFGGIGDDMGYCVKQTFDGGFVVCGFRNSNVYLIKTDNFGVVTNLNEIVIDTRSQITIYPNPLSSCSTLKINSNQRCEEIVIFDLMGREVLRQGLVNNETEITKGNLSSGVYVVCFNEGPLLYTKKIIVE